MTATSTIKTVQDNILTREPAVQTTSQTAGGSHPNGSGNDFTTTATPTGGFNRGKNHNYSQTSKKRLNPQDETVTSTKDGKYFS